MNTLTAEAIAPHRKRDLAAFASIEAWIFDLDNTLYPRSNNLFRQVDKRIRMYVAKLLEVDEAEAERIQKRLLPRARHYPARADAQPQCRRRRVPAIRARHRPRVVQPDPAWEPQSCGCRASATSSPTARATMPRKWRSGSASPSTSRTSSTSSRPISCRSRRRRPTTASSSVSTGPRGAAMFEDLSRNLAVPKSVGMTTVLVVPPGTREVFHGEWEYRGPRRRARRFRDRRPHPLRRANRRRGRP